MDIQELNEFIGRYLKCYKPKGAIMLKGEWGIGKSYYIQNHLIPYITSEVEGYSCVSISLYGIKSLSEVSKQLYLEMRAGKIKRKTEKSEKIQTGQIVAKTIIKGLTSFFNINIDVTDEDIQKLYESIDLSKKLIIFEDMERAEIDIYEFLGYVNNLVERDEIKVLLVAHEDEMIHYENINTPKTGELPNPPSDNKRELTKESKTYLKIKEKTVIDTLTYEGDLNYALKEIIPDFKNPLLIKLLDKGLKEKVIALCKNYRVYNLRSIIFACQKTVDIFEILNNELDIQCAEEIFMGILFLTIKMRRGDSIKWTGESLFSYQLSDYRFPVYYFCYQYLHSYKLNRKEIETDIKSIEENRKFDEHKARDEDCEIIYTYYEKTEKEVRQSLKRLTDKLKERKVAYYNYGKLASYLTHMSDNIDFNFSELTNLLIENLQGLGSKIEDYSLFSRGISISNKETKKKFEEIKKSMLNALHTKNDISNFNYKIENLEEFCQKIENHRNKFIEEGEFVNKLDIEQLIELLKSCSSAQLQKFRGAFIGIYQAANISDYMKKDKDKISLLIKKVEETIQEENELDSIQKTQLKWFKENLEEILIQLS